MYPGYKGQRPPNPEPISEAVKQLRELIRVMGIPEVIVPGIEADDVIGTVATRAIEEGMQVAIASPDKVRVLPLSNVTPATVDTFSHYRHVGYARGQPS